MFLKNIQELEKAVNSELASKIKKSTISFNEIMLELEMEYLLNVFSS